MNIACPSCFFATDDVDITLTDTKKVDREMNMIITCHQKTCGKQHIAKVQLSYLGELVPVPNNREERLT